MLRLQIELIGVAAGDHSEVVLHRVESDYYDAAHLDELIRKMFDDLYQKRGLDKSIASGMKDLEVVVSLSADETENVRPSLHLSMETIQVLAKAQAAFDFDPYV